MADRGLMQGTLDVLVLKTLLWGPLHGYGIAAWIKDRTEDALLVEEGALYPALHRLERRGLVASEWGLSENNRKAKYYRLTPRGRSELKAEISSWEGYVVAVGRVLRAEAR